MKRYLIVAAAILLSLTAHAADSVKIGLSRP